MSQLSLRQFHRQHLLVAAAALFVGYACQDEGSPGTGATAAGTPGTDVAQFGAASTVYRMNYVGSAQP